jgi:DNA polymerase III subunit delta'
MAAEPLPWPPALVGTPAVAVIERAIKRERLGHSLLLHGDDLETLRAIARAIADRLLGGRTAPERHPDCFMLRPTGKMRIIQADPTRELIRNLQVSAASAPRKVAIIVEADRMNLSAANIFLKTLEEPPANTMVMLLTTHPYALLPTIRSRCLHFRFPLKLKPLPLGTDPKSDPWQEWLADYRAWNGRIGPPPDKRAIADHVFSIYGLVSRFKAILDDAAAAAWEREKSLLPPELSEEEHVAVETGLSKGIRARLFAEIEEATRQCALERLGAGDAHARRALIGTVERLERDAGLFNLNLNESAALEDFLLASLRLWSRR